MPQVFSCAYQGLSCLFTKSMEGCQECNIKRICADWCNTVVSSYGVSSAMHIAKQTKQLVLKGSNCMHR